MRITLVHPAGFNFVPGQPDFSVLANRMAPIGVIQLASWLEKYGHPTAVHDCLGPYAPPTIAENAEIVLATDPDLSASRPPLPALWMPSRSPPSSRRSARR
jgi:hypothetical protein